MIEIEDEDTREMMRRSIKIALELTFENMPLVAEAIARLRNELIKQGFTREEAIQICARQGVYNK